VLYGLEGEYSTVAVANLGKLDLGFCPLDQFDVRREKLRTAVASKFECFGLSCKFDTT
jgi:hypothetical protein